MPDAHDTDFAVAKVESLHWLNDTRDIVAGARFIAWRVVSGERIAVVDTYLLTDGTIEMWLDGVPSVDDEGDYEGRAHEDWLPVLEPLFRAALEASLGQQTVVAP